LIEFAYTGYSTSFIIMRDSYTFLSRLRRSGYGTAKDSHLSTTDNYFSMERAS